MPIYEYVCGDCGYGFERMQSFHDEPLQTCPQCEGKVRRVISSVGVIFKGSGWYITDSRRQLSGSAAGASARRSGSEPTTDSESTTAGDGGSKDASADTDGAEPRAPTKAGEKKPGAVTASTTKGNTKP